MTTEAPKRRRVTIGLMMASIALLGLPIYLAVPVVRLGGIPHHMTILETARWLAIDRDKTCIRCHGGSGRSGSIELPDDSIRFWKAGSTAPNRKFSGGASPRLR